MLMSQAVGVCWPNFIILCVFYLYVHKGRTCKFVNDLKQAVILYFDTRMNLTQVMLFSNVKNDMIYLSIREISSEQLA